MIKTVRIFTSLIIFLCLTSCFPGDEGEENIITGNYYVRGSSGLVNIYIGYKDSQYGGISLVSEPITALGNNSDYIIAKRSATQDEYYILKINRNGIHSDAEKGIIGPLDKPSFHEKLRVLGQSNSIQFTKDYKKE
jgi:hypothetical protein